jgi:hypothetical protein
MQFLKYTVDERIKSRQTGQSAGIQEIIAQMPSNTSWKLSVYEQRRHDILEENGRMGNIKAI